MARLLGLGKNLDSSDQLDPDLLAEMDYIDENIFDLDKFAESQNAINLLAKTLRNGDERLIRDIMKKRPDIINRIYQKFENGLAIAESRGVITQFIESIHNLEEISNSFEGKRFVMRLTILAFRYFNKKLLDSSSSEESKLENYKHYVTILIVINSIVGESNFLKQLTEKDKRGILLFINNEIPQIYLNNLKDTTIINVYLPINSHHNSLVLSKSDAAYERISTSLVEYEQSLTNLRNKNCLFSKYKRTYTSKSGFDVLEPTNRKLFPLYQVEQANYLNHLNDQEDLRGWDERMAQDTGVEEASEENKKRIRDINAITEEDMSQWDNSMQNAYNEFNTQQSTALPVENGEQVANEPILPFDDLNTTTTQVSPTAQQVTPATPIENMERTPATTNDVDNLASLDVTPAEEELNKQVEDELPSFEALGVGNKQPKVPEQEVSVDQETEAIKQKLETKYALKLPENAKFNKLNENNWEVIIDDPNFRFGLKNRRPPLNPIYSLKTDLEGKVSELEYMDNDYGAPIAPNVYLTRVNKVILNEEGNNLKYVEFGDFSGGRLGNGVVEIESLKDNTFQVEELSPNHSVVQAKNKNFIFKFNPPLSTKSFSVPVDIIEVEENGSLIVHTTLEKRLTSQLNGNEYRGTKFIFDKDGILVSSNGRERVNNPDKKVVSAEVPTIEVQPVSNTPENKIETHDLSVETPENVSETREVAEASTEKVKDRDLIKIETLLSIFEKYFNAEKPLEGMKNRKIKEEIIRLGLMFDKINSLSEFPDLLDGVKDKFIKVFFESLIKIIEEINVMLSRKELKIAKEHQSLVRTIMNSLDDMDFELNDSKLTSKLFRSYRDLRKLSIVLNSRSSRT